MGRHEGAALAYDEAGQGDPPMVLVHGWGVGRWAMGALFERARRRRRAVSVDLAGEARTVRAHADDVAATIAALGLERAVVVGHSLGGIVALDVAARYGDRVSAVAVLEGLVLPPEDAVAGIRAVLGGLRSDRYREVVAGFMRHVAGSRLDPALSERIVGAAASHPRGALAAAMEDMLAFDGAAAAARVTCPLLYVGTGAPYCDLERLQALCPQLETEELPGSGHYFPLEAPARLGAVLARFVEASATRPSARLTRQHA